MTTEYKELMAQRHQNHKLKIENNQNIRLSKLQEQLKSFQTSMKRFELDRAIFPISYAHSRNIDVARIDEIMNQFKAGLVDIDKILTDVADILKTTAIDAETKVKFESIHRDAKIISNINAQRFALFLSEEAIRVKEIISFVEKLEDSASTVKRFGDEMQYIQRCSELINGGNFKANALDRPAKRVTGGVVTSETFAQDHEKDRMEAIIAENAKEMAIFKRDLRIRTMMQFLDIELEAKKTSIFADFMNDPVIESEFALVTALASKDLTLENFTLLHESWQRDGRAINFENWLRQRKPSQIESLMQNHSPKAIDFFGHILFVKSFKREAYSEWSVDMTVLEDFVKYCKKIGKNANMDLLILASGNNIPLKKFLEEQKEIGKFVTTDKDILNIFHAIEERPDLVAAYYDHKSHLLARELARSGR